MILLNLESRRILSTQRKGRSELRRTFADIISFLKSESGQALIKYMIKSPKFNIRNLIDYYRSTRRPNSSRMLGVKGSDFRKQLDSLAEYTVKWPEKILYADSYCRKPIGCPSDYYDPKGIYRRTNLCKPIEKNKHCQKCDIGKIKTLYNRITDGVKMDETCGPGFYIMGRSKPFFEMLLKRTDRMWKNRQQEYIIATGCSHVQKLFAIPTALLGWKGYIRLLQSDVCTDSVNAMHGETGNKERQTHLSEETMNNTEYIFHRALSMKKVSSD